MEHAFNSVLSLPVLDRRVPRTIRLPNRNGDEAAAEVCRHRIRAGLTMAMPQRRIHKSAEDVLKEQFLAMVGPEPLSETYLEFAVDLSGQEMQTESGIELAQHIALFPMENEINISRPVAALERIQKDLGKAVYAQFCSWFGSAPGLVSDPDLFSMYNCYVLEESYGHDSDEEIREWLLTNGTDQESVDSQLPEAVLAALGGKDLVWNNKAIPLAKLCQQLQSADAPQLTALAEALQGAEVAYKSYDKALTMCAGLAYGGDPYYEPIRLTAEPGDACVPIGNLMDSFKNDSMNNGEYDASFALDHVTENHTLPKTKGARGNRKPITLDAMEIAAKVVRYFSALDAALCVLLEIGAEDAIHK